MKIRPALESTRNVVGVTAELNSAIWRQIRRLEQANRAVASIRYVKSVCHRVIAHALGLAQIANSAIEMSGFEIDYGEAIATERRIQKGL